MSILCVLVLYQVQLEKSKSWELLNSWLLGGIEGYPPLGHLLVYDNSPRIDPSLSNRTLANLSYVHNPANGGTVAAYEAAVPKADDSSCEWILTLDQDTSLTHEYIAEVYLILDQNRKASDILVPIVISSKKIISPSVIDNFGTLSFSKYIRNKHLFITAIASGLLIKKDFIRKIIPFPDQLWLDYVDHWIFFMVDQKKGSICMINQAINHDLSIDHIQDLTSKRLQSILQAESFFISNLNISSKVVYPFRLLLRLFKYLMYNRRLINPLIQQILCMKYIR